MSKLEELLQGVDVEWLTLDDIARFRRGSFPQPYGNSEWYDGEESMPFVQVNDVGFNMKLVEKTKNRISKKAQPKSIFVPENTVIVTLQGSIGRVAITQYDSYVDRTLAIFEEYKKEIDLKYFAYQLEAKFNVEKDKARGNIIKTITKDDFKKFEIPIPCPDNPEKSLEIQQEIVRVLDELTSLTNQLTTELETERQNRKKQFEFFREQLLSVEKGEAEWKSLGEILNRTKGTKITASQMKELDKENGSIKIFAGGKTVAFFDANDLPEKDINLKPSIIVKSRGIIEFEYYDKPFSHKNEMWSYHSTNDQIDIKYIYYFLKINELHFQNIGKRMQMPQISIPHTDKFKIPLISMEDQKRIVKLLDQFDATHTAIEEEITKEIKLRTQQYEYYREKLLSFPQN